MKIIKISDAEVLDAGATSDMYIGKVERQVLVDDKIAKDLRVSFVTFRPGAKNKFHIHTYEQILYVLEGKGIVATEKEEYILTPGMVAFIPAGENHWHGATQDSSFSHIVIMTPGKTTF